MEESRPARLLRTVLTILLFGAVAGMMTLHLVNPARSVRLEMLERDHHRLESTISRLRDKNARLDDELQGLEVGLDGWRDVCRREYGMVQPGEVVFRFPVNAR